MDIGSQHQQCDSLKFLDDDQQNEQQDHAHSAFSEALAQAHAFPADSRKEIVGKGHDIVGCRGESFLFLIKDCRGKAGEALVARFALLRR